MWWKHKFLFTPPAPDTVEGRTLSILLTVFYHFGLFTTASNFAMSAPSSVFEHALQEKSKQGNEMVLGLVQSLGAAMVYPEATNVETNRFVRALRRERAHGRPPVVPLTTQHPLPAAQEAVESLCEGMVASHGLGARNVGAPSRGWRAKGRRRGLGRARLHLRWR